MWPKAFFRWVRAKGRSPHASGIPKNAYGPVGILLIRGASGAGRWTQPPKGVKAWGKAPWGRKKSPGTETHLARSVPQITRPAEVLPGTWRGADRDWSAVFVDRPTQRASVAQGLFYGGSGLRAVAHTRPAYAKNAYNPVGIPFIRSAPGAGRLTQPSRRR